MRLRIRKQQKDAQTIRINWRQRHRECVGPDLAETHRTEQTTPVGAGTDLLVPWFKRLRQAFANMGPAFVEHTESVALNRRHYGVSAHPLQAFPRAPRQFQPCRIGAIQDVHIMVARQNETSLHKRGMARQHVQQFRPFRCTARVRHVAGNQHRVQRIAGMGSGKHDKDQGQTFIAARASLENRRRESVIGEQAYER